MWSSSLQCPPFRLIARFLLVAVPALLLSACSSHRQARSELAAGLEQCLIGQQDLASALRMDAELDSARFNEAVDLLWQWQESRRQEMEQLESTLRGVLSRTQSPQYCASLTAHVTESGSDSILDMQIVGREEDVLMTELDVVLPAGIDTGTAISSLDARNITEFERNGNEWVRFEVYLPETDVPLQWERQVLRWVRVAQPGAEEALRRPVIEALITLGESTQRAEMILADRSRATFPLLIGRNVLQDLMLVDVGKINITQPRPPQAATEAETRSNE